MILLGKDVIGKKIVDADTNEEKAKVKDLLIEKNKPLLACLSFELEAPSPEENTELKQESFTRNATAMGSSSLWNTDAGTPLHQDAAKVIKEKQTYIVPREQIMRMTDRAVLMTGSEVEDETFEIEHFSVSYLKDFEIETEDGEKLGKVKDVVLEEKEKKVIGLKLSEGFWEKLVSDGTKYMPYVSNAKWEVDKLIVDSSMKDRLVDEYEQLV
ncbi:MAG TPA: PRC-barrel domain-containing protein [Bacillales bacterium]|nr:PRC-barrel domain-containing protein [Bacillales bacterium]